MVMFVYRSHTEATEEREKFHNQLKVPHRTFKGALCSSGEEMQTHNF